MNDLTLFVHYKVSQENRANLDYDLFRMIHHNFSSLLRLYLIKILFVL